MCWHRVPGTAGHFSASAGIELQNGLEPNVITYSATIRACVKAKQPDKAMELLEVLRQKCLEPNVFTYSATIRPVRRPSSLTRRWSS